MARPSSCPASRGLSRIDYEGELVAIIGRRLRHASPEAALAAVRGYTCGNDVTARDIQAAEDQWTRAKGFDTFCALGPRVAGLDPSDSGSPPGSMARSASRAAPAR